MNMLHPSYTDLMRVVNSEAEGDAPVVNSRYSIVMAAAKRARQIIAGDDSVTQKEASKPLSTAVKELNEGKVKILPARPEDENEDNILLSGDISSMDSWSVTSDDENPHEKDEEDEDGADGEDEDEDGDEDSDDEDSDYDDDDDMHDEE